MVVKILIVDENLSPTPRDGSIQVRRDNLKLLLQSLQKDRPDVLVLDVTRSCKDGLEAMSLLRGQIDTPVLAVTDDPTAEAKFLRAGAADCLLAPLDLLTFSGHLAAARRTGAKGSGHARPDLLVYHFAGLVFDAGQNAISGMDKGLVQLTTSEARLLIHFVQHPQVLCSRAGLEEAVYGRHRPASERAIDMLLNRLRKKLRRAQGVTETDLIRTDFRMGYMLMPSVRLGSPMPGEQTHNAAAG